MSKLFTFSALIFVFFIFAAPIASAQLQEGDLLPDDFNVIEELGLPPIDVVLNSNLTSVERGKKITLSWGELPADIRNCSLKSGFEIFGFTWFITTLTDVTGEGSFEVAVFDTGMYRIDCTGYFSTTESGPDRNLPTWISGYKSNVVTVSTFPPKLPPSVSLTANPSSLEEGDSTVISWTSEGVDVCTSSDFDTNNNTTGSVTLNPTSDTVYNIECSQIQDLGEWGLAYTGSIISNCSNTRSTNIRTGSCTVGEEYTGTWNNGVRDISVCTDESAGTLYSYTQTCQATGEQEVSATVSDSVSVTVTTNDPDLMAGTPTVEGTLEAGNPLTFSASISNNGAETASGSFNNVFQVDVGNNGVWDESINVSSNDISAGSNKSITSPSWTPPQTGNYSVRLCVDFPTSSISESNENNNCGGSEIFTVNNVNLVATCSVSPSTVSVGESVVWSSSVSGGTGSYIYSWSGTDGLSGTTSSVSKTYSTTGIKTGSLEVSSGSQNTNVICSTSGDNGENGGGGGGTGVVVTNPLPTSSFTANPTKISLGDNSLLTWSSTNANTCTGAGFSTEGSTSGSTTVTPSTNSTYQLNCSGSGGSVVKNATVTVLNPNLTLTATPTRVKEGDTTLLEAEGREVESCTLIGPGVNENLESDTPYSENITINGRSTYTLECDSTSGTIKESVIVNTLPSFEEF